MLLIGLAPLTAGTIRKGKVGVVRAKNCVRSAFWSLFRLECSLSITVTASSYKLNCYRQRCYGGMRNTE